MADAHWEAKIETVIAILYRIEKAVYGNGQKGILDRVAVLEQLVLTLAEAQKTCPAREAYGSNARRQRQSNLIALTAVLVAMAGLAIMAWKG